METVHREFVRFVGLELRDLNNNTSADETRRLSPQRANVLILMCVPLVSLVERGQIDSMVIDARTVRRDKSDVTVYGIRTSQGGTKSPERGAQERDSRRITVSLM